MRVRMKVTVSGMRNGRDWPTKGSVIDLPDGEAAEYCAAGMADPVAEFAGAEKAVAAGDDAETRGPLTTKTGPHKSTTPQRGTAP